MTIFSNRCVEWVQKFWTPNNKDLDILFAIYNSLFSCYFVGWKSGGDGCPTEKGNAQNQSKYANQRWEFKKKEFKNKVRKHAFDQEKK